MADAPGAAFRHNESPRPHGNKALHDAHHAAAAMIKAQGFAAHAARGALTRHAFERRDLRDDDVLIEIRHCGICHSDLHQINDDWGYSHYPLVPGHEIVGRVLDTGSRVTRFQPGDAVGVGCMVDACGRCASCEDGEEQFCERGAVMTYNSEEPHIGGRTFGGYSNNIVVTESFVLRLPKALDMAASAPLLCAGITTFAPLRRFQAGPGKRVGVIGLGGLGHVAIRLARAMGAQVTLFSHSEHKRDDALRLGAHQMVLASDRQAMREQRDLDIILDTVSAAHDLNPWLKCLKRQGALVLLGLPPSGSDHEPVKAGLLVGGQRIVTGSMIGGIAQTQEMLDFCGQHGITCEIERLPLAQVNTALERLQNNEAKYRFVLDMP